MFIFDILVNIYEFLSTRDQIACSKVCHDMNNLGIKNLGELDDYQIIKIPEIFYIKYAKTIKILKVCFMSNITPKTLLTLSLDKLDIDSIYLVKHQINIKELDDICKEIYIDYKLNNIIENKKYINPDKYKKAFACLFDKTCDFLGEHNYHNYDPYMLTEIFYYYIKNDKINEFIKKYKKINNIISRKQIDETIKWFEPGICTDMDYILNNTKCLNNLICLDLWEKNFNYNISNLFSNKYDVLPNLKILRSCSVASNISDISGLHKLEELILYVGDKVKIIHNEQIYNTLKKLFIICNTYDATMINISKFKKINKLCISEQKIRISPLVIENIYANEFNVRIEKYYNMSNLSKYDKQKYKNTGLCIYNCPNLNDLQIYGNIDVEIDNNIKIKYLSLTPDGLIRYTKYDGIKCLNLIRWNNRYCNTEIIKKINNFKELETLRIDFGKFHSHIKKSFLSCIEPNVLNIKILYVRTKFSGRINEELMRIEKECNIKTYCVD